MRSGKICAFILAATVLFAAPVNAAISAFGRISVNVPDGWFAAALPEEQGVQGIQVLSPDRNAGLVVSITPGDAEGADSKVYAEAAADGLKGTVPRDTGGGRYSFTIRNPAGKFGRASAWAVNGTGFMVLTIGSLPELSGAVASLTIDGEHPDVERMWAMLGNDFGHFSAAVPFGWNVADENNGMVSIFAPGNQAVCGVMTATPGEGEDTERFVENMLPGLHAQGLTISAREKTPGARYPGRPRHKGTCTSLMSPTCRILKRNFWKKQRNSPAIPLLDVRIFRYSEGLPRTPAKSGAKPCLCATCGIPWNFPLAAFFCCDKPRRTGLFCSISPGARWPATARATVLSPTPPGAMADPLFCIPLPLWRHFPPDRISKLQPG